MLNSDSIQPPLGCSHLQHFVGHSMIRRTIPTHDHDCYGTSSPLQSSLSTFDPVRARSTIYFSASQAEGLLDGGVSSIVGAHGGGDGVLARVGER